MTLVTAPRSPGTSISPTRVDVTRRHADGPAALLIEQAEGLAKRTGRLKVVG